jgi:tetratricopeptide (TPR) repeat protein
MKKMLSRLIAGPLLLLGLCIGVCQLAAQEPKKAAPTDPAKTDKTDKIDTSATKTAIDDKKKDPLILKAEEKFRKGDAAEAAKLLEDAKAKDPLLPPWRLMLSQLYLSAANNVANNEQRAQLIQNGRNLVEITLTTDPNNPDAYLHNASIALGDGRLTDAMHSCMRALAYADEGEWAPSQRAEWTKQANIGLSTVFEQRKDWMNAKKHLSKWLGAEPDNIQARQRYARACFLTEKYDDALRELKAAAKTAAEKNAAEKNAEKKEKFDPPELTMGQLYAMLIGQYPPTDDKPKQKENQKKDEENEKKANEWFTKATGLHKENARVFQAYADWLLNQGKKEEAKPFIEQADKLDAESRDTLALVGLLARYNGEYAKAAKTLEKILFENPGDFFATNQLALVLSEDKNDKKKMARATLLAEANVRSYPRSAEAHATLAWVYFREERFGAAEQEIAVAVSSGQAAADTVYYLAKILAHKESYADAFDNLDKAKKTKGPFFYRKEAETWLEGPLKAQADQEKKEKDKKKKDSPTSVTPEAPKN